MQQRLAFANWLNLPGLDVADRPAFKTLLLELRSDDVCAATRAQL